MTDDGLGAYMDEATRGRRMPARGRTTRRIQGVMNKLETAYSYLLESRKNAGEIILWAFDAVKLRIAGNTFYTPDFMVQLADGTIEFHEVKGHWEDDARVKVKVAAEVFPFTFVCITKEKGLWKYERIG